MAARLKEYYNYIWKWFIIKYISINRNNIYNMGNSKYINFYSKFIFNW